MAERRIPVKPVYTGADVTALGEYTPGDTMTMPGPLEGQGYATIGGATNPTYNLNSTAGSAAYVEAVGGQYAAFGSANTLPTVVAVNKVEIGRFTNAGDFGVGTTNPTVRGDFHGSNYTAVRAFTTVNSVDTRIQSVSGASKGYVGTVSNHAFGFIVNNVERGQIGTDGITTFFAQVGVADPWAGNHALNVQTGDARYATYAGCDARYLTYPLADARYLQPAAADAAYVNITGDSMTGPLSVVAANASIGLDDRGGSFAAYGLGCDGVNWATWFASRGANYVIIGTDTQRDFVFKTNTLDRGRFTSNGQLLVGFSSQTGTNGRAGTVCAMGYNTKPGLSGGAEAFTFNMSWTGSMNLYIDDVNLGAISLISDYRIKKNVAPVAEGSGLAQILATKPITYNMADAGMLRDEGPQLFSAGDRVIQGFLAHELEHIPGAIDGVKDEVTESGEIQPQRVNPLPILAALAQAVKEQQAMIETLQAQVAALQASVK